MNIVDKLISVISPSWALKRVAARSTLHDIDQIYGRKLDAGKYDRTTVPWKTSGFSGTVTDQAEIKRARDRAFDLLLNNQYVSKLVRAMKAQVIGTGLVFECLAENEDGTPDENSRKLINKLVKRNDKKIRFNGLQQLAFQELVMTGEVFVKHTIRMDGENKLYIPVLIESERVPEDTIGIPAGQGRNSSNEIYRGIEFTQDGQIVAYWVLDVHPNDPRINTNKTQARRVSVEEMTHVFIKTRPSAIRGITWLAPIVTQIRDISDYQYNELISSAVAACASLVITTNTPSSMANMTLKPPTGQTNIDTNNNRITRLQPGLITYLNEGEKAEGFNPSRPSTQVEQFSNLMLRGIAVGVPGVKSSTVTGDYRESSFSSERSAENDIWREIEQLQSWFADNFCQPIHEKRLETLALLDETLAIKLLSGTELLIPASWQGPVSKSINPKDDEEASSLAIATGTSSLQIETGKKGLNWKRLMEQKKEVEDTKKELGLEEVGESDVDVPDTEFDDLDNDNENPPNGKAKPKAKPKTKSRLVTI